jgi:hypothetical protein
VGTLVRPRVDHRLAVIGQSLFVTGGQSFRQQPEPVVERATISADGTLSAFETETGVTLPRFSHTLAAAGGYLYAIGGVTPPGQQTVERSPILPGDHLGAFESVSSSAAPGFGATAVMVGDTLYLAGGGSGPDPNQTIQRLVFSDGALLAADALPIQLVQARAHAASLIVGNHWYVLGGFTGGQAIGSVEIAALDDGLGPFSQTTPIDPRNGGWAAVLGDYAYLLGGQSNLQPIGSIERAALQ